MGNLLVRLLGSNAVIQLAVTLFISEYVSQGSAAAERALTIPAKDLTANLAKIGVKDPAKVQTVREAQIAFAKAGGAFVQSIIDAKQ